MYSELTEQHQQAWLERDAMRAKDVVAERAQSQIITPPPTPDFQPFGKIARLTRDCVITEKIDGTNAQVLITEDGQLFAGSRTRWLQPGKSTDNFGFAAWVEANRTELLKLGPGRHFGEWWGSGIQRGYGLTNGARRFSLFNVARWYDPTFPGNLELPGSQLCPACCSAVPVLYRGVFDTRIIEMVLGSLKDGGSQAQPGFMDAEGIVIFHTAGSHLYKKTIKGDEQPKTFQKAA